MTASLIDIAKADRHRGPRRFEVGSGYLIQLNPIGPPYKNGRLNTIVQKFGINLWLRDGSNLWHLVCLPFEIPPTMSDTSVLKLAAKWLLISPDVWEKKNHRLSPLHREWMEDIAMVNEFKITMAYTIMGKEVKPRAEHQFRRAARAAASERKRAAALEDRTPAVMPVPDVRRTDIQGDSSPRLPNPSEVTDVGRLESEASSHGSLMSALTSLKPATPVEEVTADADNIPPVPGQ